MQKQRVFLIDLDNTLLNNDHVKEEIRKSLIKVLGEEEANHFWQHHDGFRDYKKLVDFPGIIRGYCAEKHQDTCEITLGKIFQNIEFTHALYAKAYEVIDHLKTLGKVILFTEGDSIYQKMKIEKSRLAGRVDEVLLYKHKLEYLGEVMKQYQDYSVIAVEDKADTLMEIKKRFPEVFTIEVCQGHYAMTDHREHHDFDMTIDAISDLLSFNP